MKYQVTTDRFIHAIDSSAPEGALGKAGEKRVVLYESDDMEDAIARAKSELGKSPDQWFFVTDVSGYIYQIIDTPHEHKGDDVPHAHCPLCNYALPVSDTEDGTLLNCPSCAAKLCLYPMGLTVGAGAEICHPFALALGEDNLPADLGWRTPKVMSSLRRFGHLPDGCLCGDSHHAYACPACESVFCEACGSAAKSCPACCLQVPPIRYELLDTFWEQEVAALLGKKPKT